MNTIKQIWAREILDSRGIPTIEVILQLTSGHVVSASVPGGTSTGTHEALEMRDNDPNRYKGKGVLKAIDNIRQVLAPAVIGLNPAKQAEIDAKLIGLDGTKNKSRYGANAILGLSLAVSKAGSLSQGRPLYAWYNALAGSLGLEAPMRLPVPLFNTINGGLHGAGNLDFQEFHVVPSSSKTFSQGLQSCVEIYLTIGENLKKRGAIHSVGDEGGFAPNLFTNADALEIIVDSIKTTNYSLGRDVHLGLDVAANSFYQDGSYVIKDKSMPLSEDAMLEYYKELSGEYKLTHIEDPFDEDSWQPWQKITAAIGAQTTIIGDDLLATNLERVERAIKENACNAILVKPNQIGSVTETIKVIKRAREAKWRVVVSNRSGETNDLFLPDFAVGVGADFVKFGAPARGERVGKYNRLLTIEAELA